jgi:hypothetical protein
MRAAKIDANQEAVVTALRAAGATVQSLAGVGKGTFLICWWAIKAKPCLWKLRTALNRRLSVF